MPDPLDALYDRRAQQEKKVLSALESSFPLDPPNQIKGFLVKEAHKLEKSLEAARQISTGGVDEDQIRLLWEKLLDQARERFQRYRDRVTKRYGQATELPEVPVSESDHRRFQRVMERLRMVYDQEDPAEYHEELRDAIVEAAEEGNRAVVQELNALVDRERKRNRFEEFHERPPSVRPSWPWTSPGSPPTRSRPAWPVSGSTGSRPSCSTRWAARSWGRAPGLASARAGPWGRATRSPACWSPWDPRTGRRGPGTCPSWTEPAVTSPKATPSMP